MKQRTFLNIIFMAAFLFLAVGISPAGVTDPVRIELRPDGTGNGPQRRLAVPADLRHVLV